MGLVKDEGTWWIQNGVENQDASTKYQNDPGIPFKIPPKTMKDMDFQQFSRKDELLAKRRSFYMKYAQKTIFSSKYCKFVDFWFGWYIVKNQDPLY